MDCQDCGKAEDRLTKIIRLACGDYVCKKCQRIRIAKVFRKYKEARNEHKAGTKNENKSLHL